MAKLTATTTIHVQDIDKVSTLIDVLNKHIHSLPVELINSLKDLADCDKCEIGVHDLFEKFNTTKLTAYIDGVESAGVFSVNEILGRVSVYSEQSVSSHNAKSIDERMASKVNKTVVYPNEFKILNQDGVEVMGWSNG